MDLPCWRALLCLASDGRRGTCLVGSFPGRHLLEELLLRSTSPGPRRGSLGCSSSLRLLGEEGGVGSDPCGWCLWSLMEGWDGPPGPGTGTRTVDFGSRNVMFW